VAEIHELIAGLASASPQARQSAASEIYAQGRALGDSVVSAWRADAQLAALLTGAPTVGVAVLPETFEKIHEAMGRPELADVPPDQDAVEFELHLGEAQLDILTTRGGGAIEKFLEKFGEGIQQVEYPVSGVDRATSLLAKRFALRPVYPRARAGAGGTLVNFFLATTPEGRKVLIELVES
jgi:hypothetical protein